MAAGRSLAARGRGAAQGRQQLHDGTGQNLAGASLIAHRVHNDAPEPMQRPIRDLSDILRQSVRKLRTISHLLHPPLLDELGLTLVLRSYVSGFSQRSGIAVDLSLPAIERLPGDIELTLFRVIQEALTNVHRHSGSPSARIRLTIREAGPRALALTVEVGTGVRAHSRVAVVRACGLILRGARRCLGGVRHAQRAALLIASR